jgi:hypothetical protein
MKNFIEILLLIAIVVGSTILLWFFMFYILITIGVLFMLFAIGVIPVEVTHRDGTVQKYKILDLIKKVGK